MDALNVVSEHFLNMITAEKISELFLQLKRLPKHVLKLEIRVYLSAPKLSIPLAKTIYTIFNRFN